LEKGIEFITKYSVIEDSTLYLVEEFFYAALEVKQMEWARLFLQIIGNKIPQTPKHMRLLAMFHEAI
jgi:hypothetical protein